MSRRGTRRRRWLWLALATVLLGVGLPLAWQLRPLDADERRLIGTWGDPGRSVRYTFDSWRRYSSAPVSSDPRYVIVGESGRWEHVGERFLLHRELPLPILFSGSGIQARILRLVRGTPQARVPIEITIDSDDRITMQGGIPLERTSP